MTPFVLLFVQNFLVNSALNSTSLLPPYLSALGASQPFIGFYNTLGVLLIVITIVGFGRSLVRLPRVRALRWGFGLLALASVGSWVWSDSLAVLVVFKLIGSTAHVFAATVMTSLLFDLSPPHQRAGSLALFSVAGMLTNPVTSFAGEAVLRWAGGPGLFLLAAVFASAAWLWSWLLKEPPVQPVAALPSHFHEVLVRRDLRTLLVLSFFFGIYYSTLTSFLPRHTETTLGEANLSAFLTPFSVTAIAIRSVLGKQLDRRPPRRFLYLSFLALLGAQVCLLLPPAWIWIVVAGILYGVGHSILFPLLNVLFVQRGGEDQKATYSNAFLVAHLLGAIFVTPLMGAVGDAGGFSSIAIVLGAVALAGFILVRRRIPRPAAGPPSGHSS